MDYDNPWTMIIAESGQDGVSPRKIITIVHIYSVIFNISNV